MPVVMGPGGARRGCSCRGDRGAASLIVVMILFFVMSMVAAYTSRNLIFEQRTASNQYRSTRALEAAEAGVEWALTMLNSGRLTDTCTGSTDVTHTTFRERYLVIDPATGNIVPKKRSDGTDLYPTCSYDGASWTCSCPVDAAPTLTVPTGNEIYPAFRVRFRRVCNLPTQPDSACVTPVQPGVIHVDVNACTAADNTCLAFPPAAVAGEGRSTIHIVAALKSALASTPSAALTARGSVNVGAASLGISNGAISGSGTTIHSGGLVTATALRLTSKPGTPGELSVFENDTVLAALSADRLFASTFGVWRNTYRDQPGAVQVDCSTPCNAATVRDKVSLNPGRVLWLDGDVSIDSAGDIGSAAQPVMLSVTGNLTFATNVNIYGLIYGQAVTWTSSGASTVFGAVMAEGNFGGTANGDFVYDADVLTRLRTITGSFVQVPGTWRDFDT